MRANRNPAPPLAGIGLGMTLVLAAHACSTTPPAVGPTAPGAPIGGSPLLLAPAPPPEEPPGPSATQQALAKIAPAGVLPQTEQQKRLDAAIDVWFQQRPSQRMHVTADKPLYQPGESIWFRAWELGTPTLAASTQQHGVLVRLINPKGAVALEKRVLAQNGIATNDFELPAEAEGGEYKLWVQSDLGGVGERPIVVSTYEAPRIKKTLEFLRKAYGAGDAVSASVALARATGEALAGKQATALVVIDEAEVARVPFTTDAKGGAVVRFQLPQTIARGDGLLTILVEDGGVTESIQKRIPILTKTLDLAMFPEGGDLVLGLPGRVYFQAKNPIGKPADVEGRVVDDTGATVVGFSSLHDGMGRFEITPRPGRSYHVEITRPVGIEVSTPLPAAKPAGCAMQAIDDPDGTRNDVRVAVWCTQAQTVVAAAMLRERRIGDAAVVVPAFEPTVIALPVAPGVQGAVRVTLFSTEPAPLAERLLYRGRGADLRVKVSADRTSYSPRDPVALTVETADAAGQPVEADLALAVVDDTVLSFADDKTANMLAHIYLEAEMPGQVVEEPNFYFGDDPKAAQALDMVLGTQGWRRFEWQPLLAPPVAVAASTPVGATFADDLEEEGNALKAEPRQQRARRGPPPKAPMKPMKMAMQAPQEKPPEGRPALVAPPADAPAAVEAPAHRDQRRLIVGHGRAGGGGAKDIAGGLVMDEGFDGDMAGEAIGWAVVRQFPAPSYEGAYDGPRTDFRETVYWQPSVRTGRDGKGMVRFYLSDAVTSFRAVAEGVTPGGLPGRGETVVQSKLPVSLAVKLPLEVSAGDTIRLPVMLANETERGHRATLTTHFGAAFRVVDAAAPSTIALGPGERKAYFIELSVVGNGAKPDDGDISIAIDSGHLRDEVARTIRVVPLGFPQEVSMAGTLEKRARHEVTLSGALPGTVEARLTMYPSPLATMTQGTEAIIREPSGCFEQASSSNYPNVMVLGYLQEHDAADPVVVERATTALDHGYKMLSGYESPKNGYEWFGGDPGHEALSAYGLMEFADMAKVYPDVDTAMIGRTRAWLRGRRDGKGGYQRNPRALDSFGSASEEVTNGYITWALSEAGERDLAAELAYQTKIAAESKDPYLVALAANTLLNVDPRGAAAAAAAKRLAAMQDAKGNFPGADHSITRSGGIALDIETTALATLALMKAGPAYEAQTRTSIQWLDGQRSGWGGYGSTQSTVLALKTMTEYSERSRATRSAGTATILVNGKEAGRLRWQAGQQGALEFDDLAAALQPGTNTIELALDGKEALPYSVVVSWRSRTPASSPQAAVAVSTVLKAGTVKLGESARMNVTVSNVTDQGQPMALARIGLPGGLTYQTWQLKELREKGAIDFYETREREVILYYRSLAPKAIKNVDLDLIATVPGRYVAPASSAYLYYTNELRNWAEPVRVTVAP